MMQSLIETWFHWVHEWGYGGVILLMAMESSIFPVPSELVVPPAAILAAQGGGMTVPGVILAGTFGSWLGSAITYWVALLVGRPVVMKFGKYFLMPPDKVERAERFMHRYEVRRDLLRKVAAGDPPPDLDPGRDDPDGISEVQRADDRGFGALVLGARGARPKGGQQAGAVSKWMLSKKAKAWTFCNWSMR